MERDASPGTCLILPAAHSGSLGDEAAYLGVAAGYAGSTVVRRTEEDWPQFSGVPLESVSQDLPADASVVIGADVVDGRYGWSLPEGMVDFLRHAPGRKGIVGFSYSHDAPARAADMYRELDSVFVARDPISAERFAKATGREVLSGADPAFLLEASAVPPELAVWAAEMRSRGLGILGLNLSGLLHVRHAKLRDAIAAWGATNKQWAFLLLPHDTRNEITDAMLLASLPFSGRSFLVTTMEAAVVKAACSLTDGVITGRMHCGIAALGCGRPALFVDYAQKVEGLCALFGLTGCMLNLHQQDQWQALLDRFAGRLLELENTVRLRLPEVQQVARLNWIGPRSS